MKSSTPQRRTAAALAALSLCLQPATPWLAAAPLHEQTAAKPATSSQSPSPKTTASPSTTAAAPAAAPVDGGWPRVVRPAERRHHPRLPAADRHLGEAEHMSSRSARCRIAAKGADKPALGTIKLEADTSVAARRAPGRASRT